MCRYAQQLQDREVPTHRSGVGCWREDTYQAVPARRGHISKAKAIMCSVVTGLLVLVLFDSPRSNTHPNEVEGRGREGRGGGRSRDAERI
jgi:hypothetical protein